MLTKEEKEFILYWETHSAKTNNWKVHLKSGAWWGLLFALPILLNYLSGWFTNIRLRLPGTITFILLAVAGIAFFFAVFSQRFRWEYNERRYKELKAKEKSDKT
ncbi:MAG TPA: hypothetical protein VFN30_08115 [Chitinophagaceae bacterium]|nr:hypothetical protein [Chitinophagaceae bacterium]